MSKSSFLARFSLSSLSRRAKYEARPKRKYIFQNHNVPALEKSTRIENSFLDFTPALIAF